jgi:hypothetical protein
VAFAERMTDYWNNGILEPELFADTLTYYGKCVGRDHAVRETAKYFQPYFEREFDLDRASISHSVLNDGTLSVSWEYRFVARRAGKATRGTGRYFLRLRRARASFQIVDIRDDYTAER